MRARTLTAGALALLLGACAGPDPNQGPALYGELSDGDVALAAALLQDALETAPDGTSRAWSNQATGGRGRITPVRSYLSDQGYVCRDYEEELTVAGHTGRFRHVACRDSAGRWIWV